MAKFKREVIPLKGSGPIKAELIAYDEMLAMFTQEARNALVRDAIWQGGEYYRTVFVPLKFTNYAKKYGYHVSPKYAKRKQKLFGIDTPLVFTDAATHNGLRSQVLKGSRTEARATRANAYALVRMPGPAYMNATEAVYKTLRSILPEEMERVAGVVGKAMAELLNGTTSPTDGSGGTPRALSAAQASATARSLTPNKPRKAPGAPARRVA